MELMRAKLIKESIDDLFIPKSKEDLIKIFKEKYLLFDEIFNKLFPNENYDITINGENVSASVYFKVNNIGFLLSQNSSFKEPAISYLDKNVNPPSGMFRDNIKVSSAEMVEKYVNSKIN